MTRSPQTSRIRRANRARPARKFFSALWLAALACGLLSLGGCLQSIDADLPTDPNAIADGPLQWELAGKFGGAAEVETASADPWQVRFKPGGFKQIAGLCVTKDEVWVCDLGISRVQIFDYAGNYLRSFGAGVPLAGTLVTDDELYAETKRPPKDPTPRWQALYGASWMRQQGQVFKAADVVVTPDGFYVADQARTATGKSALRASGVYFVSYSGDVTLMAETNLLWPAYLASQDNFFAVSEPPGNALWLGERTGDKWPVKCLTQPSVFERIMEAKSQSGNVGRYLKSLELATNASSNRGKFNRLGGIALYNDKLIACDRNNFRIQVFDARRDDPGHWGYLERVVVARTSKGLLRFVVPLDVDVSDEGQVFVLDAERLEVAQLTSRFERVGAFGHGELCAPVSVDVAPDGRDCFITDARNNMVLHYVARD